MKDMGLNAIYDVGKCALEEPAMLVCSKRVDPARRTADTKSIVWVGKGMPRQTWREGLTR